MLKWLIALAIAQILTLGFFGLRVLAIDDRTAELAMQAAAANDNEAAAAAESPARFAPTAARGDLTADDVRQIIREEFAALSLPSTSPDGTTSTTTTPTRVRTADSVYLESMVQQDLQNYIIRGSINEAEMVDLQMKIARLPPEDRTEALIALTKALSSGDLEGRL